MATVIQIRDVPDHVHLALTEAARVHGLSLTRYLLFELEKVAKRDQLVRQNAAVIRQAQARILGRADRDTILSVLYEGRGN